MVNLTHIAWKVLQIKVCYLNFFLHFLSVSISSNPNHLSSHIFNSASYVWFFLFQSAPLKVRASRIISVFIIFHLWFSVCETDAVFVVRPPQLYETYQLSKWSNIQPEKTNRPNISIFDRLQILRSWSSPPWQQASKLSKLSKLSKIICVYYDICLVLLNRLCLVQSMFSTICV